MNISVAKEILQIRLEIDLNYVDLTPHNIYLLGWDFDNPVVITFTLDEFKCVNYEDVQRLGFKEMWKNGLMQYECAHNGNEKSYGCKDYMRTIFNNFVKNELPYLKSSI